MPNFAALTLYSTTHCHLCEEAITLLDTIKTLNIRVIDISDSQYLTNLYGISIPVLKRADNHLEIAWPFDRNTVIKFATIS